MNIEIRNMTEADRDEVLAMMRVFYRSPAVLSDGSEEIFTRDIDACVGDGTVLSGYVLESGGTAAGYAMLAHSFSTEFGCPCVWVEDIYIKEAFRGQGLGSAFLDFVRRKYSDSVIRLEVEEENTRAVHVYAAHGFEVLPYMEMIRHGK